MSLTTNSRKTARDRAVACEPSASKKAAARSMGHDCLIWTLRQGATTQQASKGSHITSKRGAGKRRSPSRGISATWDCSLPKKRRQPQGEKPSKSSSTRCLRTTGACQRARPVRKKASRPTKEASTQLKKAFCHERLL